MKKLHKKTISELFKERWNYWQNWLNEAGARDYDANQIGHAVQNEVERIRDNFKEWATAIVKDIEKQFPKTKDKLPKYEIQNKGDLLSMCAGSVKHLLIEKFELTEEDLK